MAQSSGSGGGNAVPALGIIAVVALVLFFAWFFMIRNSDRPEAAAPQAAPQAAPSNDIQIKVDLPDSIVIKP
jgi:hypothetical protein